MSKLCKGFAAAAPPPSGLFFRCSSNSARISGSTATSQHTVGTLIGKVIDVLLSIKYGIPNTRPNPTTASNIIGFLSRLSGETVPIPPISYHIPFAYRATRYTTYTQISGRSSLCHPAPSAVPVFPSTSPPYYPIHVPGKSAMPPPCHCY